MRLLELSDTLPNGLHDSEVSELTISYADRVIRMTVNVWVGGLDCTIGREAYRLALITIHDFVYCVFDRPDPSYPYKSTRRLTIDVCGPDSQNLDGDDDRDAFRLWVNEWNGFIHIRAGDATLDWIGPTIVRK